MAVSDLRKPGFLALSCVGFLSSAHAAEPQEAEQPAKEVELQGVAVTASAIDDEGAYAQEPIATPKLTRPLIDTPRSIVVLPESVIRDTGSATLVDALRTVPGITFGAAEGGNPVGDRPFIRGFDSQGSTFLDGVRDIGAQSREVFAIEQVQVFKGSDSSFGGRGSAGGTINIISKLPRLEDFARADGSFGNADYKRVTVDVNRKIGTTAAIRIAGLWHDQDVAGRDAIWSKRWGVAPSVTLGLGTPTRLTAAFYHLETRELPDSGLPYLYVCSANLCNAPAGNVSSEPALGRITTRGGATGVVKADSFYGLRNRDFRRTKVDQLTLRAEHDLTDAITIRNTARYSRTAQAYIFTQPDDSQGNVFGTTAANGSAGGATQFTSGGYVWRRANTRFGTTESMIDQTDIAAKFETGPLRHSLAAGAEFAAETARRGTYNVASGSTLSPRCTTASIARFYCTSLFTPNPGDPFVNYASDTSTVQTPITRTIGIQNTVTTGITRAGWLFDSVSYRDWIILNAGVRYDDFQSKVSPGQALGTTTRFTLSKRNRNWNYQAGLVVKPTKTTSLYGSFATSATPPNALIGEGQETNALGTTQTAQALGLLDQLRVEKTKSYEVGAKANLFEEQLSLSLAIFRTDTTNARVTVDANTVAFIGKRRVQGVEFGFNGRILPQWSVFGGYSYLDARIREAGQTALTAAALGALPAQVVYVPSVNNGRRFPQTAKHNFTIWSDYAVTPRFNLGGGAFYVSRVYGGYGDNRRAVQNAAGVVSVIPATTVLTRSIPGYWRFDARAAYKLTDHIQLSVNAQNLTDKRYFNQAFTTHYAGIAPGRTVFGTLSLSY